MKKAAAAIALTASALLAASILPASALPLISNGSFETGDFTGWMTGGNFEFTIVDTGPDRGFPGARSGLDYAVLGPVGPDATLSQTFTDTAGQQLQFSYWFSAHGDDPSDFKASFDGTQLYSQTNPSTDGWTEFVFNVTATGSDTIQFGFADNPKYMALDSVDVSVVGATPIPAALPLLMTGLGGFGLLGWRRKRKAQVIA